MNSEQQLVDCDTANSGCNGGWPTTAWNYIKSVGGSEVTSAYPYVSGTTKVVRHMIAVSLSVT